MSHALRNIVLTLVGLFATTAALAGLFAGSDHSGPESTDPGREPLDIDAYCRDRYGEQAVAYQPSQVHRWGCSTWRSGMWGHEPVNLTAACRSQSGESANSTRAEPGSSPPDQQVICVE